MVKFIIILNYLIIITLILRHIIRGIYYAK